MGGKWAGIEADRLKRELLQQRRLPGRRRRERGEFRLIRLRCGSLQMRKNARDHSGVFDAGEHPSLPPQRAHAWISIPLVASPIEGVRPRKLLTVDGRSGDRGRCIAALNSCGLCDEMQYQIEVAICINIFQCPL